MEGGIAVNSQAFQVTYEQRVQALLQDAVNLVKAFFDSAVHAMNVEADDVGRSAILNEGMINVQFVRIDDALAGLSSEWEHRCNNSQEQHHLQERVGHGKLRSEEWTCLPILGQRREDDHRAGGRAHGLVIEWPPLRT